MSRYVKTVATADGGGGGGGGAAGISLAQACTAACCVIAGYAGTAFACGSLLRTRWQTIYACNCWDCGYGSQWIEMILPTTKYCAFCIIWNGIKTACCTTGQTCWAFGTQNYFMGRCNSYPYFYGRKTAACAVGGSGWCGPGCAQCMVCLTTACNNECHGGFFGWEMCISRSQGYGDYLCWNGNHTWNSTMLEYCITQTNMCAGEHPPGYGCCVVWGRLNDYCMRTCGGSGLCWSPGVNIDGTTTTDSCECCASGSQFSRFRWRHNQGVAPMQTQAAGCDPGSVPSWYVFGIPWCHAGGTCCEVHTACTEDNPQFLFYPGQTVCKDY